MSYQCTRAQNARLDARCSASSLVPKHTTLTDHEPRVRCTTTSWSLQCPTSWLFLEGVCCDFSESHAPIIHRPLTQVNVIGSSLQSGISNMGLYHHLVCVLSSSRSNIVNDLPSDSEITFFWRANRQSRRSVARMLFMLVSFCACWMYHAQMFSRTATSRLLHFLFTSTGASTNRLVIQYAQSYLTSLHYLLCGQL